MTKRDEQKEKRRQEILLCSLDTFIKKGFAETKIRDIANDLKISTGLFFHYFKSKESVYEELINIAVEGAADVLANDSLKPMELFEHITDNIFNSFAENSMSAKLFVFVIQALSNEVTQYKYKDILSKANNLNVTVPMIVKGQAEGTIKSGDPLALSIAFWGAIQGIAEIMAYMPESPCPKTSWIVDILRRKD